MEWLSRCSLYVCRLSHRTWLLVERSSPAIVRSTHPRKWMRSTSISLTRGMDRYGCVPGTARCAIRKSSSLSYRSVFAGPRIALLFGQLDSDAPLLHVGTLRGLDDRHDGGALLRRHRVRRLSVQSFA